MDVLAHISVEHMQATNILLGVTAFLIAGLTIAAVIQNRK